MARKEPAAGTDPSIADDAVETLPDAAAASGTPGTVVPRRASPLGRIVYSSRGSRLLWIVLAAMGPGLVAANAGNDAGGIATYSSVGASYGYSLLWAFPLILISLSVIQEMAARMGAATGKGLSDLIRENFSIHMTAVVMLALLIANGGTVVSEFLGIAASVDLVVPGGRFLVVPIAAALWLMVVKGSYRSVEKIFLIMTLVFFAYPVSAVLGHPDWGQAARSVVVPTVHFNQGYLFTLIALIGTSITPYMQVYVQSAVADKGVTPRDYLPERIGVYSGSLFAMLVAAFIVVATASTLYPQHIHVDTADQAARALAPLAGAGAKYLFAVGLFGASMLAAAVLPLATAYSVTEALGVEKGQDAGFSEAPIFTGIFTGLMVVGTLVSLIPGLPIIQVLLLTQVVDCLLLPFVLFSILRLANNRKLMGDMVNGPVYNTVARIAAVVVTVLSIALLVMTLLGIFGLGPTS